MALLVILGTAVYGGSVSAEETQEQADSASVTLSNDYIYLDPTGMDMNQNADWNNDKANVCIRFTNASGGDPKGGKYENGIWKFKVPDFSSYGSSRFYFTYIYGTNDDWGQINDKKNPYYRTGESTLTVDAARGSVVVQNGTTIMNDNYVYTIAVKKSYADNTLSFVDMTGTLTGIQAQFSVDGTYSDGDVLNAELTNSTITIPQNGINPYQYMRYVDANGKAVTDSYKIGDAINNGSILYYGVRKDSNGIKSVWSKDKKNSSAPTIAKLYFNKNNFPIAQEENIKVKIGDGDYEKVSVDSEDSTILSYNLNEKKLSSDTIIGVEKGDTTYRFYPNGNLSLVTIYSDGNAGLNIYKYKNNPSGECTVYYDATLSKLSYKDTNDVKNDGKGIPYLYPDNTAKVYYYATNGKDTKYGLMTADKYPDVYKVNLPDGYDQVRFAAYEVKNAEPSLYGDATDLVTIPGDLMNPCYYGDTSDDVIYNGGNRGGYWDEAYIVRDPEKEAKQHNSKDVVDINDEGTFTRNASTLYVNSTFYDYYTDYELNGKNRDDYDPNNPAEGSQRSYVTFRQFDQALSDYYKNKEVSIPIYTGHFQPDYKENNSQWGNPFSAIAGTLDLYGYNKDDQKGFMSTNNSTLDANGDSKFYDSAAQGLVANALNDENNLMTSDNKALEPHFNEEFLTGNNSKRTALAKVYKNVSFPFTKQKVDDNGNKNDNSGVEYWYFDSADTTLAMRTDKESGSYYLKDVGHQDWSKNVNSSSKTDGVSNPYGFFPFNETAAACSASNYNYGFGTKLEFKFRLTDDGTVVGTDGGKHPIKFNFSGDDDVWVYVDGKLALDVGGAHGKVTGHIDFKNKIATVSSTKKSQNESSKKGAPTTSSVEIKGSNSDEHTLTMFYMERGMWESNMKVSFNFPDENEFQVEKNVDTTDVNKDIFPDTLFDNTSVFPFTIQNQATHFGIKQATAGTVKPAVFNDTFDSSKIQSVYGNKFEYYPEKDGQSDVVHWWAAYNDEGGSHKDRRWGIISPKNDEPFDATYKVGNTIQRYKYLQFKFYYDDTYNPSIKYMYIGLEDNKDQKTGKYLTQDIVTINNSLSNKKWITVNVDVSQLVGDSDIDLSKLKYIKFNYDYSRNFYLDDFKFIPSAEVTEPTGFVTKQHDIADYGSVKSGTLMYPENAVYTISSDKSSTTNIMGDDGKFVLANGETATFSDQFRRGSYIALSEDVDTEVFETSWTMYENGEPVTTTKTGNTVDLTSETTNLTNQPGSTIKDGRKEKYKTESEDGQKMNNDGLDIPGDNKKTVGYPGVNSKEGSSAWAKKNGNVNTDDVNTIVFRSYSDPDNSTIATKLKVKYTNKVKTGTITIKKKQAAVSDELKGEYTFKVKFFNVAGMNLEGTNPIEMTCYINKKDANGEFEPIVIKGIPAGTQYTISEISASDGAVLDGVDVSSGDNLEERYKPTVIYDDTTKLTVVSGAVKADAAAHAQTEFIFTNKLKPVINIKLTKKWANVSGVTIPDSINIQLQRRVNDGENWEQVKYATPGHVATDYITLTKDPYNPNKDEWTYSFTGLDRYANGADGNVDTSKPYKYRIVEVTVADGSVKPIKNSEYLNDLFKVTYTDAISAPSEETGSSITKKYTITNTYSPLTNIKITKVDATDTSKKLNGVEFKLEKLVPKSAGDDSFIVDNSFGTKTATTAQGIAEFKDLEDGIYRLTETKTVKGYNLLKDPITIKIKRNQVGETTVDGQPYNFSDASDKNTIELKISNRMKFLLPKTGGYGAMLFILCGIALATLCCLIFFLINLRKEVQYSRLKRQRRNAIGK